MNSIILNEIEFNPSPDSVLQELKVAPGSITEEKVLGLLEKARQIALPKAMFRVAGIDHQDKNSVVIDGVRMESKIIAVNLRDIHRVFPYLATSGRELFDWKMGFEDMTDSYYAEQLSQIALRIAEEYLEEYLQNAYQLGLISTMNPGSLEDWPINAQKSLFRVLGESQESIGVELLSSMLMLPSQTVSGIYFESEDGYTNCALCPREICSHRETPYDPDMLKDKYT